MVNLNPTRFKLVIGERTWAMFAIASDAKAFAASLHDMGDGICLIIDTEAASGVVYDSRNPKDVAEGFEFAKQRLSFVESMIS